MFNLIKRKLRAWINRINPYHRIRQLERLTNDMKENFYYEVEDSHQSYPHVLDLEDTMQMIAEQRLSVCRYGDGEFEMIMGINMTFQTVDFKMQQRLKEILENPVEKCLCCIPKIYGSLGLYIPYYQDYWRHVAIWSRRDILPLISSNYQVLGNAEITRPYMGMRDKTIALKIFEAWKALVANKRVLIVEGRYSRLGVGNDLFASTSSIRRIWCPSTNAFTYYDEILTTIRANADDVDLILLALGGVATILAYDLSKEGYWAIDAGHIDVEYCWMNMGAMRKVPIPGRYVAECMNGREEKSIEGEEIEAGVIATVGVL